MSKRLEQWLHKKGSPNRHNMKEVFNIINCDIVVYIIRSIYTDIDMLGLRGIPGAEILKLSKFPEVMEGSPLVMLTGWLLRNPCTT